MVVFINLSMFQIINFFLLILQNTYFLANICSLILFQNKNILVNKKQTVLYKTPNIKGTKARKVN